MEPQQRKKSRTIPRLVLSLLLFAIATLLFLNRQLIIDQVTVWQFRPSPAVAALSERAELTDYGKFYFYASSPELQNRDAFNKSCSTLKSEETVVLGCYAARRIYVFNVEDPRLDGIKEVTAAHEMLHAAYDRMGTQERNRVNGLLEEAAGKVTDKNLRDLLKEYEKTEPGERLNELHSILGTQVGSLGSELEAYYKKYFTDRQALVTLAQKYEALFNDLKSQQEQLAAELEALASQLAVESNSYNQAVVQLNADITNFNSRASSGSFSTQSQFNAERNKLIASQEQLRTQQATLNAKIAIYNAKREQLTAINSQAEALNRSINSNLSPVPAL